MKNFITTAVLLLLTSATAWAQGGDVPHYRAEGYSFFGVGPAIGSTIPPGVVLIYPALPRPSVEHVGLGADLFLYKGLAFAPEVGYAHWGAYDQEAGVGSLDLAYHFLPKSYHGKVEPFVLGGYTCMFNGGFYLRGGANFGAGANVWLSKHAALRLETRDEFGRNVSPTGYRDILEFRLGVAFR
jgi:hypothetical protein